MNQIQIKPIAGKGVGVIASHDIPAGTIILREFPLILGTPHMLSKEAIYAVLPLDLQKAVDSLWTGPCVCRERPCLETPFMLKFYANAFTVPDALRPQDLPLHETVGALYDKASRFNHACHPNTSMVLNDLGEIQVITLRAITAGEELTKDYLGGTFDKENSRKILQQRYGFTCNCEACKGIIPREYNEDEIRIGSRHQHSGTKPVFGPRRATEPPLTELQIKIKNAEDWAMRMEAEWNKTVENEIKELEGKVEKEGVNALRMLPLSAWKVAKNYEISLRAKNAFGVSEGAIVWHMKGRRDVALKMMEKKFAGTGM